jgi:excisionase family DNA binding protein
MTHGKHLTLTDTAALLAKTTLHTREAAFLLDVSPRTVERYLNEGKLAFRTTPGGHRRTLTASLLKHL